MAKAINYPTQEWIDKWIDKYMDENPDERIDNFDALKEMAECEWWDNEADHDRPTPYDLTPEQEKVSQEARKGARAVNAYGKQVKRERKPNQDKRDIISALYDGLLSYLTDEHRNTLSHADVTNVERQIDFEWQGTAYSVTLTAHRPPKTK
jgi:C-terminal processing protease CtpA/Prc